MIRAILISISILSLALYLGACSTNTEVAETSTQNPSALESSLDTGDALSDLEATIDKENAAAQKKLDVDELEEPEKSADAPSVNVPTPEVAAIDSAPPPPEPLEKPSKANNLAPSTPSKKVLSFEPLPQIPGKAIPFGDAKLNRFYFARSGDTPEKISRLLYGNPKKVSSLKTWNKSLKPGSVVFYETPIAGDLNDPKMKSFFQERGVPPQEYMLEAKENLYTVAKKLLGDKKSWKEIALINGFDYPEMIGEGQKLAFYPKDLSSYQFQPSLNKQEAPAPAPPPIAQTEPVPSAETQGAAPNPLPETTPGVPEDLVAQKEPAKKDRSNKDNFDIQRLLEQNLFAIAIGGVVLGCLVGLLILRRRRTQGDNLIANEDDLSYTPPKKNRKT